MVARGHRWATTRTVISSQCLPVGVDRLPVTADTSAAIIGFQLNFNTLAKAAIMGLYKR